MKKLIAALGILLVLLIGAMLILPSLIPAEKIKDEVVAQVKAATGRDLTIDGKVSVSVFPSLSVQVSNVALSSPAGFQSKDLLRLGAVDVRLKLFPLLGGTVAVDSFVLVNPTITLEVARNGKANWQFDSPAKPAAAAEQAPAAAGQGGGAAISNIALGQVRLENGKLTYIDGPAGTREDVDGLTLSIDLKSLDDPLAIMGGAKWRGKQIDVIASIAKPRALLENSSTNADLSLKSDAVSLIFRGDAAANGQVKGNLELAVPSVRGLGQWATGKPVAMAGSGLGPFSVKAMLVASQTRFALSDAILALDTIKAKGDLSVDISGPRPSLKGKMDVEALDLNPYLASESSGSASANSTAKSQPAASKKGWNDSPIDASGLKAADVDFALSVGSILVDSLKIGKSSLHLTLQNGRMVADLSEMALYKGNGKGKVTIDAAQPSQIGLDAAFALKNVQAEPFLTDAADFARLEGTAHTDIQISGRGKSERAIISSLAGKGSVSFLNGAIKGINLADMIRNVAAAFQNSGNTSGLRTEFAELMGTFTIANGIVSNNDLSLKSPLLRVGGSGTVDLPQQSLKYRVEPKVVASLQGQGGQSDMAGLSVPVLIEGPWDNLSYRPDLEALVKGQASKAIQDALGGKGGSESGFNPAKLFGR